MKCQNFCISIQGKIDVYHQHLKHILITLKLSTTQTDACKTGVPSTILCGL